MANEMTREGYQRLMTELEHLRTVGRDEIASRIREARSFGDLSENAEYDEAMNAQAIMEARISKLEAETANATIIDESDISTEIIKTGVKVTLKDIEYDEKIEYQILGKSQADPDKGIISDSSPVGMALLNKKIGDTVTVELPNGATVRFEILDIAK
ncbi:MAG: transcription elongation factor GreA [Clostridiales bacterium]|jgi:transcription elongation factor GreA|nr:transcription elongation factor GreA [Clostridiales bacterium]